MKVALYSRVSTAAQAEEGYSIAAQQERLVAYCKAMGKDNYEFYTDAGFSGSNINRPEMQRLISDVKLRKVESVIVFKLDRLSRSQKDTLYLIEDIFEPNNVSFKSINESFDTGTPFGKAMVGLLSVFAQLERENIYLRTREGMRKRCQSGYWKGGGASPHGYRYDKNTNSLVVVPEEAEKVKEAFSLYLQGKSAGYIAKVLGFRSDVTVFQILRRPIYKGYVTFKGNLYPGNHEPLISEEVFEKTQEMLASRSTSKIRSNNVHLLTGLVYCGCCGLKFRYIYWGKKGYKLVCYSRDKTKDRYKSDIPCNSPSVWAKEIEDIVLNDLFSMNINTTKMTDKTITTDTLSILKDEFKKKEQSIQNLYELYAKKPDETILTLIDTYKADLEKITDKIEVEEKYKQKAEHNTEVIEKICKVKTVWSKLTPKQQQIFLRDCIEKIVISDNEINILYKFEDFDLSYIDNVA